MGAQASHLPLNHNGNNTVLRGGQTPQIHQLHHPSQPSTSFTKRLSIRRSKKRRKHERLEGGGGSGTPASSSRPSTAVPSTATTVVDGDISTAANNQQQQQRHRRMDRLRRSLRDSFRRRKDHHGASDTARPHLWQADEKMVREGSCSFHVKYLGCVQVYESRGMQVCEDAIKLLRAQRRRPLRSVLYVTGDGLRVVDDDTKDLLVDQTIEKVSFCAPDRSLERGFSYICRDGTTRRWMCHGFMAIRESGERLSHAVGCAFAICLERKQQRDKECGVTMSLDPSTSSFTRYGSFRQATITERLTDPQDCKPADPVPVKAVENPFAVERPHAPVGLFERQGSLRVSGKLSDASPFKRHASLRLSDLPSTLQRQQLQQQHAAQQLQYRPSAAAKTAAVGESCVYQRGRLMSLPSAFAGVINEPWAGPHQLRPPPPISPLLVQLDADADDDDDEDEFRGGGAEPPPSALQVQRGSRRLMSLPANSLLDSMAPIPEAPASVESEDCDNVTLLCQELSQGLGVLSSSSAGPANAGTTISPVVRADEWLSALPGNGSAVRTGSVPPAAGSVDSAPPSSTATSCSGPGSWTLEEPLAPSPVPTAAASAAPLSWTAGTGTAVDPFGSEWSQIAERNNAATTATATGNPFLGSGHGDRSVKAFEVHM